MVGHGTWSGGGSKAVRAVVLAAVGFQLLLLAPGPSPAQAVVPGSTGRIVFTSDRTGNFEIFSMNPDGSGVTQLTDDPDEDREPVWSPAGTRIVFVSYGHDAKGTSGDVFVMNADGTGVTNLTSSSGLDDEPVWSPDGTRIAWRSNRTSDAEVFIMNADGTGVTQLTDRSGVDDEPTWSPDGERIGYRRCTPSCHLYTVGLDGLDPTEVKTSSYGDDPAWSPDATRLAYRGNGIGNEPDIMVVGADSSDQTNLSNDEDSDVDPAWSPDGTMIAYVRQPNGIPERTGNGEIWLMKADGSSQVNLTNDPGFDGDPDFQTLSPGTRPAPGASGPSPTTTTAPPPAPTTTSTTTPPAAPPDTASPGPSRPTAAQPAGPSGYRMVGSGGTVYAFGEARHLGDVPLPSEVPAVDLEQNPMGDGYWVVDRRGGVHIFGSALGFGSAAGQLAAGERATSLSATPTGAGYWIFTDRGRAFPFGDATFLGDLTDVALNGPVLDSVPTPTGLGYYMVASDGGVFTFGDATFAGSTGAIRLNAPVQSLVPDPDGAGYWLVASDGGVFTFDTPFRGSMGGTPLNRPMTGMVAFGDGYLMVAEDGGIFNFSDRPFDGSLGASPPVLPIVSVAASRH